MLIPSHRWIQIQHGFKIQHFFRIKFWCLKIKSWPVFGVQLLLLSFISRCVDDFCDPLRMSSASVTDLMICAPWDTQIFSCLADGRDHTPCCSRKSIPPICQVQNSNKVYCKLVACTGFCQGVWFFYLTIPLAVY